MEGPFGGLTQPTQKVIGEGGGASDPRNMIGFTVYCRIFTQFKIATKFSRETKDPRKKWRKLNRHFQNDLDIPPFAGDFGATQQFSFLRVQTFCGQQ